MILKDFDALVIKKIGQEAYDRVCKEADEEYKVFKALTESLKNGEYLTEAQASKILGTSKATVKKWALRGKIPHIVQPINGRRRYLKEVIEMLAKDVIGSWK